jgi:protein gp37
MGVSVESQKYTYRIEQLTKTKAAVKFISFEPLIGPITKVKIKGVDWVIVGGESGPKARPIDEEWVIRIRDICLSSRIPFFFKQWGGVRKKENGRSLQGKIWNEWPNVVSVTNM